MSANQEGAILASHVRGARKDPSNDLFLLFVPVVYPDIVKVPRAINSTYMEPQGVAEDADA